MTINQLKQFEILFARSNLGSLSLNSDLGRIRVTGSIIAF